jgi:hypothetical protein
VLTVCIPVDSMLWALVARIRDDSYTVSRDDLRALLGSGCSHARAKEVLEREAARHPAAPFGLALETLAAVKQR